MKKLLVFKEPEGFVLERVNEFNRSTKRYFNDEQELIETLKFYPDLNHYEIKADAELASVISALYQQK